MAETTIALGGNIYTVRRLPIGKALAWRKRAGAVVDLVAPIAEKYQGDYEEKDLIKAARSLLTVADGALEEMLACVVAASPELAKDKQYILDNAFDEELLEAFQSVLLLNSPLAGGGALDHGIDWGTQRDDLIELALAEWGLFPHEFSQEELEHLAVSWMRRKKLEARLVAIEVGKLFSGEQGVSQDAAWAELAEYIEE